MKRITPRTCLWPLTGSLIASFALSLGLTFRSDHHCYAGTCGAWLFPLQTRLHIVIWYCWLSLSVILLALRAFHPSIRRGLHKQLYTNQLPVVRKSLTISGVLVVLWVLSLYGIIVGIWWLRLQGYFVTRGEQGGMMNGNRRVAAVALTGHICDVTMGMVLLPVARNVSLLFRTIFFLDSCCVWNSETRRKSTRLRESVSRLSFRLKREMLTQNPTRALYLHSLDCQHQLHTPFT